MMKVVSKSYYICEICGRTSQNESKILECQKQHRFISNDCEIEHEYEKGKEFPRHLQVTFPDGTIAGYYKNYVRMAPKTEALEEDAT